MVDEEVVLIIVLVVVVVELAVWSWASPASAMVSSPSWQWQIKQPRSSGLAASAWRHGDVWDRVRKKSFYVTLNIAGIFLSVLEVGVGFAEFGVKP